MKTSRLISIGVASFATAVILLAVFLAHREYREPRRPAFTNAPKLIEALQAFSRDQTASGRNLADEVSLNELMAGGYVSTNDAAGFEGMDQVAFFTRPEMFLARARTPDGQFICLMLDGSVQILTASRFREAITNSGQQGGPADVSQPFRSTTNQAPGAAGSRR